MLRFLRVAEKCRPVSTRRGAGEYLLSLSGWPRSPAPSGGQCIPCLWLALKPGYVLAKATPKLRASGWALRPGARAQPQMCRWRLKHQTEGASNPLPSALRDLPLPEAALCAPGQESSAWEKHEPRHQGWHPSVPEPPIDHPAKGTRSRHLPKHPTLPSVYPSAGRGGGPVAR